MQTGSWPFFGRLRATISLDLMIICAYGRKPEKRELSTLEIVILLLEDRRFFQHGGVDWRAVLREIFKMLTFQKFGGASTIDMQFVRTSTGYRKRSLRRKAYEMLLATMIQSRLSKSSILSSYLEIMYLGSGLTGVDAASKKLFSKSATELAPDEAATIASLMVYPRPIAPTERWENRVAIRSAYGLKLYRKLGARYLVKSQRALGDTAF